MKISDQQIVQAIRDYRLQPLVDEKHGPVSLKALGVWIAEIYKLDTPVAKGSLSPRIRCLWQRGFLGGEAEDDRVMAFTLYVTKEGMKFLEEKGEPTSSSII